MNLIGCHVERSRAILGVIDLVVLFTISYTFITLLNRYLHSEKIKGIELVRQLIICGLEHVDSADLVGNTITL